MKFEFQPDETARSVSRISKLWPSALERMGSDFRALFHRLSSMGINQVLAWAEGLMPGEIDQICDKIHQAPDARTTLAIVFILASRDDRRLAEASRYFFFTQPDQEVIDLMRTHQQRVSLAEKLTELLPWFVPLLSEEVVPNVLQLATNLLERGQLDLNELDESYVHTPLYRSLIDLAFDKGGAMLQRIKPKPAHERAMVYLKQGHWPRIVRYISEYPSTHWRPSFLEALYKIKGRPAPHENAFYAGLPEGSLWTLRKRLFQSRMNHSKSPQTQQAYWLAHLHRCQDWVSLEDGVLIVMRPLSILEEKNGTRVRMLDDEDREIAVIPHDHSYEHKMNGVLQDFLPW